MTDWLTKTNMKTLICSQCETLISNNLGSFLFCLFDYYENPLFFLFFLLFYNPMLIDVPKGEFRRTWESRIDQHFPPMAEASVWSRAAMYARAFKSQAKRIMRSHFNLEPQWALNAEHKLFLQSRQMHQAIRDGRLARKTERDRWIWKEFQL